MLHKPDLVVNMEVTVGSDRIAGTAKQIGFTNFKHGEYLNTHISYLDVLNDSIAESNVNWSTQLVTSTITKIPTHCSVLRSFVHAACELPEREHLWEELIEFGANHTGPWLVGGLHFTNDISSWVEKEWW